MGDEFQELNEEQLLSFCKGLGLAKDGFLDETELAAVCRFIGLNVPEEAIGELFLELDEHKTGKIRIDDLCLMLKGMRTSEQANSKGPDNADSSQLQKEISSSTDSEFVNFLRQLHIGNSDWNRNIFSILEHPSGLTRVGNILALWSELGISQESGQFVLKDLGILSNSPTDNVNLQELTKCIEEELDNSKELGLPLTLHACLMSYKTEAYYLRSLYENIVCERDKLKADILDANERNKVLAQEIDEQNSRLERNSQIVLKKMDAKYNEQVQDLQRKLIAEKESIQQCLQNTESELEKQREENNKFKTDILNRNMENSNLEKEVQNLNKEIKLIRREREGTERELARLIELSKRNQESDKRANEKISNYEFKLKNSFEEIKNIKDRNDELNSQLESLRGTIKILKASEEKRYYNNSKRRKGLHSTTHVFNNFEEDMSEEEYTSASTYTIENAEECNEIQMEEGVSLADEQLNEVNPFQVNVNLPNHASNKVEKLEEQYKTLETEMDSVKSKIVTILSEKEILTKANEELRKELEENKNAKREQVEKGIQINSGSNSNGEIEGNTRIKELEEEIKSQTDEKVKLNELCQNLETSLNLLQAEYEKMEDYWHNKLQEEREMFEGDRRINDEKLNELTNKIQEFEEAYVKGEEDFGFKRERLPVIEEQASLEQQVTDLTNECETVKMELSFIKKEYETQLSEYQNHLLQVNSKKSSEEYGRLEAQISALTLKCQEYENRLSSLIDDDRSTIEKTEIVESLKERIMHLEESHRIHVENLKKAWEDKEKFYVSKIQNQDPLKLYNPYQYGLPPRNEATSYQPNINSTKGIIEMVNSHSLKDAPSRHFVQKFPHDQQIQPKPSSFNSLPYIPQDNANTVGLGIQSTFQDHQESDPNNPVKKGWCHVELGFIQNLKSQIKQKVEQCLYLQKVIQQKDIEHENHLAELKYNHDKEISSWSAVMQGGQELARQQAQKLKMQAEKLAHSDMLVKSLWVENAKLMAALGSTEQRVSSLEGLLKFHQQQAHQQQPQQSQTQQQHINSPRNSSLI